MMDKEEGTDEGLNLFTRFLLFLTGKLISTRDSINRIPFPIIDFLENRGIAVLGWAGSSMYFDGRKEVYEQRVEKAIRVLSFLGGFLIILIFLIFLYQDTKNQTSFLQGFIENVYADLLAGLTIALIIARYLERRKDRQIQISYRFNELEAQDGFRTVEFFVSLRNVGSEEYKQMEINWEVLLDSRIVNFLADKQPEFVATTNGNYFSFSGYNNFPIFPKQFVDLFRIRVQTPLDVEPNDIDVLASIFTPNLQFPKPRPETFRRLMGIGGETFEDIQGYRYFQRLDYKNSPYRVVEPRTD